ncbi:TetR/AcrR family transcriptional regulator [Psychrobacillus sp. OK032]|uniref:TetR/AcrR family transcriptional regulator n=1 Tax=Psychrobacillus sp. OK032 TaxID=1884358 RepID=UPI0008D07ED6|nr:TetR/AcrR family transcriptional regulator [Psychrobacillus sp. OK032]SES08797.1 transcriptional regulator, TetR family [Psychrobacillus sp. OK032]
MNTKKRNILEAAQRLFIEKGFRSTTVNDIIEEAKVSKGTFYNYFSSKNECIIAILENARKETVIKRKEIHTQQNASDVHILTKQLSIRLTVYEEHNLFPLFASIINSQDVGLRDLIKRNYIEEINWLSNRLIDVFGEQTKNVATDCAVLALGMIQQLQHPWINPSTNISFDQLIEFILRRIKTIIYEMTATNDSLLINSFFKQKTEESSVTREHVIELLKTFYLEEKDSFSPNTIQAIEFVLEELSKELPRIFLLENIVPALTEAFTGSQLEQKSTIIIYKLWALLDEWREGQE